MPEYAAIIDAALGDQTTLAFLYAIGAVFVAGFLGLLIRAVVVNGYSEGIALGAPNLMTTLGVLGTFTGIFLGLVNFDVTDINASVPQLLAGMKIAFITSIAGMGAAIV
ncbi:hypothetical protein [Devosia indica]